jgi:hypothetical protein
VATREGIWVGAGGQGHRSLVARRSIGHPARCSTLCRFTVSNCAFLVHAIFAPRPAKLRNLWHQCRARMHRRSFSSILSTAKCGKDIYPRMQCGLNLELVTLLFPLAEVEQDAGRIM